MVETVTYRLAEFAESLRYEDLSAEAIEAAKRFILDSIGCALGGKESHDCQMALKVLTRLAGPGRSGIIGREEVMDPVSATLMNALLIRVLDYNDIYWKADPSHPSDLIPVALAACQDAGLGGRDLLLGVVLAYEMEMRLCEFARPGIRERGWHHATLTAFAAPIVAGRLYGLSPGQIQHAVGISASHSATLGAVTAGKLTMMKNTVDPMASQAGLFAALLAKEGYTGPEHVLDGKEGLAHCLGPDFDFKVLTDGLGDSWRITSCSMKAYPTEALTHAPISVVLDLVTTHDLAADQIQKVEVYTLARAADILADESKYDPRTKETADHSLPYCLAVAIVDRRVTTAQFTDQRIMGTDVRKVLPRIEAIADAGAEEAFPARQLCRVVITTTDGEQHAGQVEYPKGDPRNPMTQEELESKFVGLTGHLLGDDSRRELYQAVEALPEGGTVERLMEATQC